MKRSLLACCFILGLASPVLATPVKVSFASLGDMENCTSGSPALLNSSTICGGANGVRLRGVNAITFIFNFVRGGTATAYSCNVEALDDRFGTFARNTTQSVASGVVTMAPESIARTVSVSETLYFTTGVNFDAIRLVCSGTSATAADTLQVQARIAFGP